MEIERKFLIKNLPENILSSCEFAEIEQEYLDFGEGEEPEKRIRLKATFSEGCFGAF